MAAPRVGEGRLPIELQGKSFELVPSLGACIEISGQSGGINGAVQRCLQLNFETICAVIGAGIEVGGKRLNPRQREDMLPQAIYEAGLIAISAICVDFLHIVANGGRMPSDDEEDEDQEGQEGDPLESPTASSTSASSSA